MKITKEIFLSFGIIILVCIYFLRVGSLEKENLELQNQLNRQIKLNQYHHEIAVSMYVLGNMEHIEEKYDLDYQKWLAKNKNTKITSIEYLNMDIKLITKYAMNQLNELLNEIPNNVQKSYEMINYILEKNE